MTPDPRRTFLLALFALAACQPQAALLSTPIPKVTTTASPTPQATLTLTILPTPSHTASPTFFPLPITNTLLVYCDERQPASDDRLAIVTASFGLAQNFIPSDLVRLGNYLPGSVTLPELLLRQEAAEMLGEMVKTMKTEGLKPQILSAYRSYFEQAVSHQRWLVDDPANANQISALPGHSEHQLGTVIDFGSAELADLTGDVTEKFSPLFAQTSEGIWLAANAQNYGFTMTNPPQAQPLTGLAYEPWHYRYVGVDLAAYLRESGYFLVEFLFKARPGLPCLRGLTDP